MITFFVVIVGLLTVVVGVFVVLAKLLFGQSDREWPKRELTDTERRSADREFRRLRQRDRWSGMTDHDD